jgi:hypothetical protein
MFGDIFVKIFKFLRILSSLYKILVILKVKFFYPIEFGRIIFRIANHFLGENLGKLAHERNLAPKIIPSPKIFYNLSGESFVL